MEGIPVDNPEQFRALAHRLAELLGEDALSHAREQRRAFANPALLLGSFNVTRAFDRVRAWAESLSRGEAPADPADMLRFALLCMTVDRCAALPGGDTFLKRLRASLRSGQFDRFEDVLFEGEVAVYWLDQMRAVTAHFSDLVGHPDLWVQIVGGHMSVRIALECKRIQPTSSAARQLQSKVDGIEKRFAAFSEAQGGLKCIVWLHTELTEAVALRLHPAIERVVALLPASDAGRVWQTIGDDSGAFQVSAARLGDAAVRRVTEHRITDVPAEPVLAVRADEIVGDGHRVKSVLSVRTDRLPHRTGNLSANVLSAIDQLTRYSPNQIGMVAIRLRHPRSLGDLWEADRAIRGALELRNAQHVALVALFWDENTSQLDDNVSASQARTRTVVHSLKPYFIANTKCWLRFDSIDSFASTFPESPQAFIRDPVSGDIRPLSSTELSILEQGGDHPARFEAALARAGDLPEEAGSATLYFRLAGQLAVQLKSGLVGTIRAGGRQFRIMMEADGHLRTVEVRGRRLTAVATIDLRAWYDADELGIIVKWDREGFTTGLWCRDEKTQVVARSSRLRAVPEPKGSTS